MMAAKTLSDSLTTRLPVHVCPEEVMVLSEELGEGRWRFHAVVCLDGSTFAWTLRNRESEAGFGSGMHTPVLPELVNVQRHDLTFDVKSSGNLVHSLVDLAKKPAGKTAPAPAAKSKPVSKPKTASKSAPKTSARPASKPSAKPAAKASTTAQAPSADGAQVSPAP